MDSWLHQNMIDELSKLGIVNHVIVPVYSQQGHIVSPKEYVNCTACFKKIDRLFFHYKQKKIIRYITQNYNVSEFDCIHAYTLFTDGNVARVLSEQYGIPYIVAVRNTDVNTFFKYLLYLRNTGRKILNNASQILFLSEAYHRQVLDRYIFPGNKERVCKKCEIIPNGIDDYWLQHLFYNKNREETRKRLNKKVLKVLYVGGINKNKNIELTIRAICHLKEIGWNISFSIIGNVQDRHLLSKICKNSFVRYEAAKKKEELIHDYRQSDIFIMPSHTETFGLVYAEAMSQGVPVIYTRHQGFDGQFQEGMVGYAVSDRNVAELETAILRCVEQYEEMSKNAVKCAKRFSWQMICEQYNTLYRNI